MRTLGTICLAAVIVVTLVRPAEAGRRSRRSKGAAAAAVAAAAVVAVPKSTVVAAAPVVISRSKTVAGLPDLLVTEMTSKDGTHTVVVKNIGDVAAPSSVLRVDFCRVSDGAVVASAKAIVEALQVNQSVRVNIHHIASAPLKAVAYADANLAVVEKDEINNVRAIMAPGQPLLPLKDVNVEAEPMPVLPTRS
jgi:hypothetical protein